MASSELPRGLPKSMRDARPIEIDAHLDLCEGERPLADPAAAGIVECAIRHFDGARFRLLAWVVMPNHAHVVLEPLPSFPLGAIVRSWKAFSATQINKDTGARGPFWARDYFDRYSAMRATSRQRSPMSKTIPSWRASSRRRETGHGLPRGCVKAEERPPLDREPSGSLR